MIPLLLCCVALLLQAWSFVGPDGALRCLPANKKRKPKKKKKGKLSKAPTVDMPNDSEEHRHLVSEFGMESGDEIHCAEDDAAAEERANGDDDMICSYNGTENEIVDRSQCDMEEEGIPLETSGKLCNKEKCTGHGSVVKCSRFDPADKNEDVLDVSPAANFADYAGQCLCLEDLLPAHGTTSMVHMSKYWSQRYRLFSKYEEGICMDKGEQTQL